MREVKTLKQAVRDEIIQGFVANGCEFSAYTITVAIRAKVNNGMLEIDGIPYQMMNGVNTQVVSHGDVRDLVRLVTSISPIANYVRNWRSAPNTPTGGYWVWSKAVIAQPCPQVPVAAADDDDDVTAPVAPVTQSGPIAPKNPSADPNDPEIIKMLTSYFDNRISMGQPASLHTAQSRMKRHRLTIAQIMKIAEDNGYAVEPDPCAPMHAYKVKKAAAIPGKRVFISFA
jgi:hypothetical protein